MPKQNKQKTNKQTALKPLTGRPSKYKPEYDMMAYDLCALLGAETKQLRQFFKVDTQTLYNWNKQHPSFFESIKRGRDYYNTRPAERALLKRVKGFYYYERTIQQVLDKVGTKHTLKKKVRKYCPPDPVSIFFYLCNRTPDRWKHRSEVDVNTTIDHNHIIKIDKLPFEQKKQQLEQARKQIESKEVPTTPKRKKKANVV